jgi:hypothetical protein
MARRFAGPPAQLRGLVLTGLTVLIPIGLAGGFLLAAQTASAQRVVRSTTVSPGTETYVCPKCGRLHRRTVTSRVASPSGETVTRYRPSQGDTATTTRREVEESNRGRPARRLASAVGGGVSRVLDVLNRQRARQGLRTLRYDPQLQEVANRRVQRMAAMGMKGHPPGSFSPGRYEGVGWSSSFSPSGVSACYTSDPRMSVAGAAMARGRDGVYFCVVYR